MIMTELTLNYLIQSLAGTPDVAESLLRDLKTADDPRWDARPDPDRFTLREVVAHLADWNPIFQERIERIREEIEPDLPSYDEGKVAIERDYAHSDPLENLKRFRTGRAELVDTFKSINDAAEWERIGHYDKIHVMTIETYLTLIVAHDGYHTDQMVLWLR